VTNIAGQTNRRVRASQTCQGPSCPALGHIRARHDRVIPIIRRGTSRRRPTDLTIPGATTARGRIQEVPTITRRGPRSRRASINVPPTGRASASQRIPPVIRIAPQTTSTVLAKFAIGQTTSASGSIGQVEPVIATRTGGSGSTDTAISNHTCTGEANLVSCANMHISSWTFEAIFPIHRTMAALVGLCGPIGCAFSAFCAISCWG
jgi:hypothetical protein